MSTWAINNIVGKIQYYLREDPWFQLVLCCQGVQDCPATKGKTSRLRPVQNRLHLSESTAPPSIHSITYIKSTAAQKVCVKFVASRKRHSWKSLYMLPTLCIYNIYNDFHERRLWLATNFTHTFWASYVKSYCLLFSPDFLDFLEVPAYQHDLAIPKQDIVDIQNGWVMVDIHHSAQLYERWIAC